MTRIIRDESTASAYWAAVNTFCALEDVHVIADAPVGCYNLVGVAVMDYTDAIPYLENLTPTSLTEKEISSEGSAGKVREIVECLQDDSRHLIVVSSAESEMIGGNHAGMLKAHFPGVGFFNSNSLGENEWQGRDRALEWLFREFDDPSPAEVVPGTVSIIGPTFGCFNSPSDLAEIKRLVEGCGLRVAHVYPLESRIADIAALKHSEVIVVMYQEFGKTLADLIGRPVLQAPFGIAETEKFITRLGSLAGREKEAADFLETEKKTTLRPLWDLWRGPQSEWFPTVRFGVVADRTYAEGLKRLLGDELGMQCLFSHDSVEADNNKVREELASHQPQFFFGRMADKIYLAELEAKTRFIPAGFPGPVVRRALGTPFMGHSGIIYLVQEIVNALYDTLFHFLPISSRTKESGPTQHNIKWTSEANELLEQMVKKAPFISQISFGREMKKKAESLALQQGKKTVTSELLQLLK
ncbi:chlorophyllide a reductase subunit Z [Prosthecochloris sp. HL-130-GSB]|jgi:3,8-divinyl chlorophyllide a/chlorophyllide a reductase subunit Z|uniref:Chlorophyllide a reductase subunit Z n=1 Tax=Prosthecochloris aestuarii TaxID=1102 RepID=A0A831SUI3_PROAE|nr:chlorophyllide a reductase subunit Z [Prosthecochloris sp. HL-130-GSB]ARM30126.1 chlorophyllide a reductase subunit Z [Prosthecochloris sp. HL-130-GSB]MBO8091706.1 chlorophyllide a reductase subunit Z [Prosthecochloris sp.]HED31685.1 chlorophyllide a reductase subunit Z [Prosthecochloris aestuarii]